MARPLRSAAALLALLVALPLAGCLEGVHIDVRHTEPPTYNDRIRLDREGLTGDQATRDVYRGPYRDGETGGEPRELVSPLYPLLREGREEKLVQSQCYWTARLPNQGGDLVLATWEVLVTVAREGAYLACESPRHFGACRVRHPQTGRPIVFRDPGEEFEGCPDEPTTEGVRYDAHLLPEHFVFRGGSVADTGVFADDLVAYVQQVRLRRAAPDPDRRCPGSAADFQPFGGGSGGGNGDPVAFLAGELGCGRQEGLHSACGVRCAFEPTADGTLHMNLHGAPAHPVRPNLRVVEEAATLRRVMAPPGSGGLVRAWSTGVAGQSPDLRWHENFSPRTAVRRARLYQRLPDGTEAPLELAGDPRLVLDATWPAPGGPVSETWSCRGTEEDGALVVPLFGVEGVECDGPCTGDALAVTPTYVHAHLDGAAGPLTRPLRWQVELAAPPLPDAEVVLELQLRALLRPAALQVTEVVDLGTAETGQRRYGEAQLRNVGWQVMRIDDLRLEGTDAGDFAFRLPAASKPVHLPVKVDLSRPGGLAETLRFLPEPLAWSLPPLRRVRDHPAGGGHLRIHPPEDGAAVEYLGSELRVRGRRLVYEDPTADFTIAAEPGEHFPFVLTAHDAFAERSVPFTLLPAEAVEIRVSGSPGGYGDRTARLVVEGVSSADPSEKHRVASALVLEGRTGALLEMVPATPRFFPTGHPDRRSWRRHLLLVSFGDTPARRGEIALEGDGAAFFALVSEHDPEVEIGPGESEIYTVEYLPACLPLPAVAPGEPWERRAALRVSTDAGDFTAPLVGAYGDDCGGTVP